MPYGVIIHCSRKAGLGLEEFKDYYENKHVPLVKSLIGDLFPKSNVRHHIARQPATSEQPNAPFMLLGQPSDASWDAITVLTFEDEQHFKKCMEVFSEEEIAKKLRADEYKFIDRSSLNMVILGDLCETRNETML
jgi:hypothetical protein